MKYNPEIHKRRSIRLKGYDYSQAGLYFITICCGNRICRFGHIEGGKMILNEYGIITYHEWLNLVGAGTSPAPTTSSTTPPNGKKINFIKDKPRKYIQSPTSLVSFPDK